jgi:beta-galactosidase beta subunit|tara:strand:- start:4917 stop:5150 length:234 start_codon:yes stop_codon:yes gene_type:complete
MAKKVTKEELKQIQNFVNQINNGTTQLGQIEIQKHGILHALSNIQNDLSVFQNELKEKYGDVKVNLQTGKLESNIVE